MGGALSAGREEKEAALGWGGWQLPSSHVQSVVLPPAQRTHLCHTSPHARKELGPVLELPSRLHTSVQRGRPCSSWAGPGIKTSNVTHYETGEMNSPGNTGMYYLFSLRSPKTFHF